MSEQQSIKVEIHDQIYNIRSDGDNQYILDLAAYVDAKMREISSGTMTADSLKVAILAALHIADEYFQLRHTYQQMDSHLAIRSMECAEMLDKAFRTRDEKDPGADAS